MSRDGLHAAQSGVISRAQEPDGAADAGREPAPARRVREPVDAACKLEDLERILAADEHQAAGGAPRAHERPVAAGPGGGAPDVARAARRMCRPQPRPEFVEELDAIALHDEQAP